MSADNVGVPALETELRSDVRVDCYVRAGVSVAVTEQLKSLVERLRTLDERDIVADVRVDQWPSQRALSGASSETRDELVAEFEGWADRRGYSLEPAFRRKRIPPSPLGVDDAPDERIRVPLLALVLSEDDDRLRGVVPYTDRSRPDEGRTYTVEQWLDAAERRAFDAAVGTSPDERTASPRGRR